MLRNCVFIVIAHMLDATQLCLEGICLVVFVQSERAAELALRSRQISPKSQQREKMVTTTATTATTINTTATTTSSSRASRWRKFQKKKELYSKERICL